MSYFQGFFKDMTGSFRKNCLYFKLKFLTTLFRSWSRKDAFKFGEDSCVVPLERCCSNLNARKSFAFSYFWADMLMEIMSIKNSVTHAAWCFGDANVHNF